MAHCLKTYILFFLALSFLTSISFSNNTSGEERWMAVYSNGKRVGYSYSSRKEAEGQTEAVEVMKLSVKLLDSPQEIDTRARYLLDGYRINEFDYEFKSPAGVTRAEGVRQGDRLQIKIKSVSEERELDFPGSEPMIPPSMLPEWLAAQKLEPGESYSALIFDPALIIMGSGPKSLNSVSNVLDTEIVDVPFLGGFETIKVVTFLPNMELTTWITDNGDVIKQAFPPEMTAFKDTKSNILKAGLTKWDVAAATSIPADTELKNARKLNYMKVRIEGVGSDAGFDFNDGYRQSSDDGTVEIRSGELSEIDTYTLPYGGGDFQTYLDEDELVQSGHREIILKSEEILNGETDSLRAASRINDWVYENLKKRGSATIPSALDVLKTGQGDCNEHSALFAALARAAGIPTKTVSGTLYIDRRFYYHAWNEVFVGKWVAVDPTFGQFPADATHIKFIEGDLQKSSRIMKAVGKINLKILEAS